MAMVIMRKKTTWLFHRNYSNSACELQIFWDADIGQTSVNLFHSDTLWKFQYKA